MALPSKHKHYSVDEYLELDRASDIKHEYLDGEIVAMTGASESHNLIVRNVIAYLHPQLRDQGCKVYPSDMRVFVPRGNLYTYPDAIITCEQPRFDSPRKDTLLNPNVIFEVLSPSTEAYDRGKKFLAYRSIIALNTYVLIAQDEPRIEVFTRQADGDWTISDVVSLDAQISLTHVGCVLVMSDIYEDVFPAITDESTG